MPELLPQIEALRRLTSRASISQFYKDLNGSKTGIKANTKAARFMRRRVGEAINAGPATDHPEWDALPIPRSMSGQSMDFESWLTLWLMEGDRYLGFSKVLISRDSTELQGMPFISVVDQERGKGLGLEMSRQTAAILTYMDVEEMAWECAATNEPSLALASYLREVTEGATGEVSEHWCSVQIPTRSFKDTAVTRMLKQCEADFDTLVQVDEIALTTTLLTAAVGRAF